MLADSSIPREYFLDLMGPPNCLLSMPGNPGTSRNTSAVHAMPGDRPRLCYWISGMAPGLLHGTQLGHTPSSCILCIPSFARADGSVSCLCHAEPFARPLGELLPPESWLLLLSSIDTQDPLSIEAFRDTKAIPSFEGPSGHHSFSALNIDAEREYLLGNISQVSSNHPFPTSLYGLSVKTCSVQGPCNLLDEQHSTGLNNLPLQITDTLPPGLATSLCDDVGGATSPQSILHPNRGWGTNDSTYLTDLDIDLLETSDDASGQPARDINWCEIDALSAPDTDDTMSREPLQGKNVPFASLPACSAVRNPDCSATRAQSRPTPNTPREVTSNFSSSPNEGNDSKWTTLQAGPRTVRAEKTACARPETIGIHDGLEHEPSNLHSFELTAGSPVASLVVASKWSRSRRFQCSYPDSTGRSFSRRADRDRHMRKHSAMDRTFVCTEPKCGKRFYRKDKLPDHSRHIHYPKKAACTCAAGRK